jgi:hypothetical protein
MSSQEVLEAANTAFKKLKKDNPATQVTLEQVIGDTLSEDVLTSARRSFEALINPMASFIDLNEFDDFIKNAIEKPLSLLNKSPSALDPNNKSSDKEISQQIEQAKKNILIELARNAYEAFINSTMGKDERTIAVQLNRIREPLRRVGADASVLLPHTMFSPAAAKEAAEQRIAASAKESRIVNARNIFWQLQDKAPTTSGAARYRDSLADQMLQEMTESLQKAGAEPSVLGAGLSNAEAAKRIWDAMDRIHASNKAAADNLKKKRSGGPGPRI